MRRSGPGMRLIFALDAHVKLGRLGSTRVHRKGGFRFGLTGDSGAVRRAHPSLAKCARARGSIEASESG
jgi:hypothetical protein